VVHAQSLFDLVENEAIVKAVVQVTVLQAFGFGVHRRIKKLLLDATGSCNAILDLYGLYNQNEIEREKNKCACK